MARITGLREERRGGVAVELDGAPWRTVPIDVAARAGLSEGRVLDRAALRALRRELRRAEALAVAGRALRLRDLSRARLVERLEAAHASPETVRESIRTLEDAGLVDDQRFAHARAETLAGRGYGDTAVRHDLERQGVAAEAVEAALDALEPEAERARRLVDRRGKGPRTARYLAGRGFAEETCALALEPGLCN